MAENESQLDRIEGKVDTLCLILTGDGEPQKGLVVRFDRVEQAQKRVRWFLRSVAGACIAAIVVVVIVALRSL